MSKSTADWLPPSSCQGIVTWKTCRNGDYPTGAVKVGLNQDDPLFYVGRTFYEENLLPAKVTPNQQCAYISYCGQEISLNEYEVLVGDCFAWKPCRGGDVSRLAIQVGFTADEEALYFGRTLHEGTVQGGKVHPSHGCLYVPYGGEELTFEEYEVLIRI